MRLRVTLWYTALSGSDAYSLVRAFADVEQVLSPTLNIVLSDLHFSALT